MAHPILITILCTLFFGLTPGFTEAIDPLPAHPPPAVGDPDPMIHEYISRGVDLVYRDRHEESIRVFNDLLASRPEHPAPYFLRAASYQSWMNTFRTNRYQRELEENVRLAVEKGKRSLAEKDDPWIRFYMGSSYGYQALNHFRKYLWINAYLDALNGVDNLKASLVKEPRLYDAYLGLGTYYYWRTAKSRFIRNIAFWMEDRRESAIAMLGFVFEHGLYAKHEAGYSLIVTYWDSGRYEKALEVVERILKEKESPSVTDLYYKGRILASFKRWPELESIFRQVLERLSRSGVAGDGYQVECKYWIARALFEQGQIGAAMPFLASALEQNKKRNERDEPEGYFESHAEIQDLILDLNEAVMQAKPTHPASSNRISYRSGRQNHGSLAARDQICASRFHGTRER